LPARQSARPNEIFAPPGMLLLARRT